MSVSPCHSKKCQASPKPTLFCFHVSTWKMIESSASERCLGQCWQLCSPVREKARAERVSFSRPDLVPFRLKHLSVLIKGSVNQNIADKLFMWVDEIIPDNVVLFDLEKELHNHTQSCTIEIVAWRFDCVMKSGEVIKMELILGAVLYYLFRSAYSWVFVIYYARMNREL